MSKIGDAIQPFKSEIDWSKWNSDIPKNTELMKEYRNIEKQSKKSNTWMKNTDNSSFQGTPEQFIQQQSVNFKKAFPEGFTKGYRGANQHISDFANRDRNDFATFLTNDLENAKTYVPQSNNRFFTPNESSDLWKEGLYELAIPNNYPKVTGSAGNKSWRLLNYDDKIAKGTIDDTYTTRFQEDLKRNALTEYNLPSYNPEKKYLSTDIYANYVMNPNTKENIAQIDNVVDAMGDVYNKPSTVFAVNSKKIPLKSLMYNDGMFDVNNPNIYKGIVPGAIAAGAAASTMNNKNKNNKFKYGGKLLPLLNKF
jgi:hypothetical protein